MNEGLKKINHYFGLLAYECTSVNISKMYYREGIEKSAMIHIRTKTIPTGNKKPKLDNYYTLVKRGLI